MAYIASEFGRAFTMFMSDVDMIASSLFFERCARFAVESQSVYFPIVWKEKKPKHKSRVKMNELNLRYDFRRLTKYAELKWSFFILVNVSTPFSSEKSSQHLHNTVLLKFFHTTLKHNEFKNLLILAQSFSYPSIFLAKIVIKTFYFHFF